MMFTNISLKIPFLTILSTKRKLDENNWPAASLALKDTTVIRLKIPKNVFLKIKKTPQNAPGRKVAYSGSIRLSTR